MNVIEKHLSATKRLAVMQNPQEIGNWLLSRGYYPEQYVLPPPFEVVDFPLEKKPFFKTVARKNRTTFEVTPSEMIKLSFPKSNLAVRSFSVIEPKIYHDIVWYMVNEWPLILRSIIGGKRRIIPYSFPVPLDKSRPGQVGGLRSGRMIYEFLQMAENDLVAEAYNYRVMLITDISNFYPSIYTHSIAWALHGKNQARGDKNYLLLGNKLDKLVQYANDRCTNGIAIGPAVSDIIAEIISSAIDRDLTKAVGDNIDFIAVRFKDDYRILAKSEDDAKKILHHLQKCLFEYNLSLNDKKTEIRDIPEGLYREWAVAYQDLSLRMEMNIDYRKFERNILAVMQIDAEYPGTGIIDRFLSELHSNDYSLKCSFSTDEARKAFSLLMLLRQRRAKSFPHILGMVEALLHEHSEPSFQTYIAESIVSLWESLIEKEEDNEYEVVWLTYFLKWVLGYSINIPGVNSPFVRSIVRNKDLVFESNIAEIFNKNIFVDSNHIWKHISPFIRL